MAFVQYSERLPEVLFEFIPQVLVRAKQVPEVYSLKVLTPSYKTKRIFGSPVPSSYYTYKSDIPAAVSLVAHKRKQKHVENTSFSISVHFSRNKSRIFLLAFAAAKMSKSGCWAHTRRTNYQLQSPDSMFGPQRQIEPSPTYCPGSPKWESSPPASPDKPTRAPSSPRYCPGTPTRASSPLPGRPNTPTRCTATFMYTEYPELEHPKVGKVITTAKFDSFEQWATEERFRKQRQEAGVEAEHETEQRAETETETGEDAFSQILLPAPLPPGWETERKRTRMLRLDELYDSSSSSTEAPTSMMSRVRGVLSIADLCAPSSAKRSTSSPIENEKKLRRIMVVDLESGAGEGDSTSTWRRSTR